MAEDQFIVKSEPWRRWLREGLRTNLFAHMRIACKVAANPETCFVFLLLAVGCVDRSQTESDQLATHGIRLLDTASAPVGQEYTDMPGLSPDHSARSRSHYADPGAQPAALIGHGHAG